MADAGEHAAPAGADRRLARRTHRPERVPSQVTKAVIPRRLLLHRRCELRRAAFVLVGVGFVMKSWSIRFFGEINRVALRVRTTRPWSGAGDE